MRRPRSCRHKCPSRWHCTSWTFEVKAWGGGRKVTHTLSHAAVARGAVFSGLLLVTLGVCAGLLIGPSPVHLLGLLGLHVESGTATLVHRVFV